MLAGGERVLVGVSGGADSVALLAALLALAPSLGLELHVLHVDHQLRADSSRDAAFVEALGRRLGERLQHVEEGDGVGAAGDADQDGFAAREHRVAANGGAHVVDEVHG